MTEKIKQGLLDELKQFTNHPHSALSWLTNIRTSTAARAIAAGVNSQKMEGITREETAEVFSGIIVAEDGYKRLADSGSIFHRNQWDEYVREEHQTQRPFDNWWDQQVQPDIISLNR